MGNKDKKNQKLKEPLKQAISLKSLLLPISALVIVILLAFKPSLQNQFTNWDDGYYVTNNTAVHKYDIKGMFSQLVTDVYVPLTLMSFGVEYHFFKLNPFFYILDNILLHIAVTLMIFIFALKIGLKERSAFLGALLFGIHPMHVESVAWITERKDVLYSFFYMLAILQYWHYLESKKTWSFGLTFIWGILSMLAKPMALSLPFVLLVCDWLYQRKIDRHVLLEKALHLIYIVPLAFLTFKAHYARAPLKDFVEGSMLWLWSFTFYLRKFFFPLELVPIYNVPKPIGFSHIDYNIAFIVFCVFMFLMIRHRQNRWLRFAFFYYLASIFFIIRMKVEVHVSTVADRFMYLPSLGFCLLIGYFIDEKLSVYKEKSRWKYITTVILTIGLFCFLAIKTSHQTQIWKNNEVLWNLIIKTAPNSTSYNNRGQYYLDTKRYDLAIKDFNSAIQALPSHFQAHYNKGLVYQEQKMYDKAIECYNTSLKYNPKYYQAYHNKSYVYLQTKKYDLAIESCKKGLEINPESTGMNSNCAKAHMKLNLFPEAYQYAQKAKSLGYEYADELLKEIKKAEDKLKSQAKK